MNILTDTIYIIWIFVTVAFFANEARNFFQLKRITELSSKQLESVLNTLNTLKSVSDADSDTVVSYSDYADEIQMNNECKIPLSGYIGQVLFKLLKYVVYNKKALSKESFTEKYRMISAGENITLALFAFIYLAVYAISRSEGGLITGLSVADLLKSSVLIATGYIFVIKFHQINTNIFITVFEQLYDDLKISDTENLKKINQQYIKFFDNLNKAIIKLTEKTNEKNDILKDIKNNLKSSATVLDEIRQMFIYRKENDPAVLAGSTAAFSKTITETCSAINTQQVSLFQLYNSLSKISENYNKIYKDNSFNADVQREMITTLISSRNTDVSSLISRFDRSLTDLNDNVKETLETANSLISRENNRLGDYHTAYHRICYALIEELKKNSMDNLYNLISDSQRNWNAESSKLVEQNLQFEKIICSYNMNIMRIYGYIFHKARIEISDKGITKLSNYIKLNRLIADSYVSVNTYKDLAELINKKDELSKSFTEMLEMIQIKNGAE